jgi:hypothetical protein
VQLIIIPPLASSVWRSLCASPDSVGIPTILQVVLGARKLEQPPAPSGWRLPTWTGAAVGGGGTQAQARQALGALIVHVTQSLTAALDHTTAIEL